MSILLLHSRNLSRRRHLAKAREYCCEHGERLLLLMKGSTWESEYADVTVDVDTSSIEATVARVHELAAAEMEPITAVATFTEPAVPAAAAVAAALGLPSITEQAAYLARDKFAMRTAFAAAGLPQPAFGLAATVEQAHALAARLGYPVVVKPFIGAGSKYVQRIDDPEQFAGNFAGLQGAAWENFGHDPLYARAHAEYGDALLVEEYVPGGEISVESLIIEGMAHVVAIHDKPLPMTGPFFEEVYFATPTVLPDFIVGEVVAATQAATCALGITTGATHTEFRITENGRPVLLEVAARAGGACIYQSVLMSTGFDLVAGVLDLARGRRPQLPAQGSPAVPVGHYLFFAERPGRLVVTDGLAQAREHAAVTELELYHAPGDVLNVPPHVSQAHGHVVFTGEGRIELSALQDELAKLIRLHTEE
jgi:biotin carboxylase